MDYQTIKKLKKERGCSYEDLIVLSAQNDPFYVGMGRQVRLAEWFADLWNKLGYAGTGGAAHIRRIHYRAISQNIKVLKPDGSPYSFMLSSSLLRAPRMGSTTSASPTQARSAARQALVNAITGRTLIHGVVMTATMADGCVKC